MKKVQVFFTQVSTGSYKDFIDNIIQLPEGKSSSYVCFANVHMITHGYHDEQFNHIINKADIVAPDGKPIALFLKHIKRTSQVKVSGPDILPDLLRQAEQLNKRVFFYGSTETVLKKIISKVSKDFPSLKISGYYAPPFTELSTEEKNQIIKIVNEAKPDFMFVSLGCPKQERWMAEHAGKINACMLGVGQALQLYAGETKRAPVWMQSNGLEWAYRLWHEPRRLWKRYAYTNTIFLFLMMKHLCLSMLKSRSMQ